MLLAEKGLPTSANAGYELFDKLGSIGLTSFMQEITRRPGARRRDRAHDPGHEGGEGRRACTSCCRTPAHSAATASRPRPPSSSERKRPDDFFGRPAIRHLVAAAIPGMTIDQVTVLSTDGTVLACRRRRCRTRRPAQDGDARAGPIAKELQDNVRKTLSPYLGLDNFEISVAARLNTDKRQINETNFDPDRARPSARCAWSRRPATRRTATAGRAAVGVEQNIPADQTATRDGGEQTKSRTSAARS